MITIRDVIQFFDDWIPRDIGWSKDRTGFQIGDTRQTVKKILLALDTTLPVLRDAIQEKANLLITHHPFLFNPINQLHFQSEQAEIIRLCLENNVSILSAHTNLDFVTGGVSTALATKLGISDQRILSEQRGHSRRLDVYVPGTHEVAVRSALAQAGAGRIGNYTDCSFRVEGTGTFRGNSDSKPFIGKSEIMESVEEVKIEMTFPAWKESAVLSALHTVHPYETPAYQIFDVDAPTPEYGAGVIGNLSDPVSLREWVAHVQSILKTGSIRWAGSQSQEIRKVAVCGGSGSDLISTAKRAGADCLVTADLKYHQFFESTDQFSLVDAGHYETEIVVMESLQAKLQSAYPDLPVQITTVNSNPVRYHS